MQTSQINLESLILKQANIRDVRQSCSDYDGRTREWFEPRFNDVFTLDVPVDSHDGDPREQYGFELDDAIELGSVGGYELDGTTFSAVVTRFARVQQYPTIVRLYVEIASES